MTSSALLRSPITAVWAALVVATLVSWFLGTDHGIGDHDLASVLILVVAFVKIRFVGAYFMELRHAPRGLRLLYEAWCIVVCAALVVLFLAL